MSLLRRLNQRTASVAGVSLIGASELSPSSAFGGASTILSGNVGTSSSPYIWSGRSFLKVRLVKSPNDPSNSNGGENAADGASSSSSSSSSSSGGGGASSSPAVNANVINSAEEDGYSIEWNSKDFYKRLGLDKKCSDKEIRARYIDLAKKYHPDLASTSSNEVYKNLPPGTKPEEVFKNIKEAYEALSNPQQREYIDARGSEEFQERQSQGYGVSPEEYARQQAVKQLFTDGLPFFIASVVLFMAIMANHFKSRINTASLFHFIIILLVLSFFPRILAACIMYLMHANDMIEVFEKEAQAASIVSITATQQGPAAAAPTAKKGAAATPATPAGIPMNVTIRAEGIDEKHIPEGNMVVTVKKAAVVASTSAEAAAAEKKEDAPAAPVVDEEKEVFVFAKGVTAVTLPLMMPAPFAVATNGIPAPHWEVDVKFVNDGLKLTLMEKKAFL